MATSKRNARTKTNRLQTRRPALESLETRQLFAGLSLGLDDPYAAYNFMVVVEPQQTESSGQSFAEMTGLEVEIPPIEYRTGTEDVTVRKVSDPRPQIRVLSGFGMNTGRKLNDPVRSPSSQHADSPGFEELDEIYAGRDEDNDPCYGIADPKPQIFFDDGMGGDDGDTNVLRGFDPNTGRELKDPVSSPSSEHADSPGFEELDEIYSGIDEDNDPYYGVADPKPQIFIDDGMGGDDGDTNVLSGFDPNTGRELKDPVSSPSSEHADSPGFEQLDEIYSGIDEDNDPWYEVAPLDLPCEPDVDDTDLCPGTKADTGPPLRSALKWEGPVFTPPMPRVFR